MLAHRLEAPAEIEALRADRRRERLGESGWERRAGLERAQEVLVGRRMEEAQERQDLVADRPRFLPAFDTSLRRSRPAARQFVSVSSRQSGRAGPIQSSVRGAVQVAAPRETSRSRIVSTSSGAVCRSRAAGRGATEHAAHAALPPRATTVAFDHFRAEHVGAEAHVVLGVVRAAFRYVQRRAPVAASPAGAEAGGVGAGRAQARGLAAGRDQPLLAEERGRSRAAPPCADCA